MAQLEMQNANELWLQTSKKVLLVEMYLGNSAKCIDKPLKENPYCKALVD